MPKLLQINVTANWGSTGRIAEDIGNLVIENGWDSWIAYGRGNPQSRSKLIRIGNDCDMKIHAIESRLFDNHGLASKSVTKNFISEIEKINPDIIHLHNIHGYYLNYPILFDYLKKWGGPVVWTLHDCWPFTGHCAYYDFIGCDKWKSQCGKCQLLNQYPRSLFIDRSYKNFKFKKETFRGLKNLTLVPVSDWLNHQLSESFMSEYNSVTIHNGIDIDVFKPKNIIKNNSDKKIILGVASVWDRRKGLDEFIKLRKILPHEYLIILVGLTLDQISSLPEGITGIRRTDGIDEMVNLYNMADVFVNPTLEDNFPTTNLEALACGIPVITYNTGGSPEAIDKDTGCVVEYRNINQLSEVIQNVCEEHSFSKESCRMRAVSMYDKKNAYEKYIQLYKSVLL